MYIYIYIYTYVYIYIYIHIYMYIYILQRERPNRAADHLLAVGEEADGLSRRLDVCYLY